MKIAAVIPVKGREPLFYWSVKRLTRHGVIVICVGHTDSERIVCESAGGVFYQCHEGSIKLGGKWQLALDKARDYSPDAVLYVGSSDWVSDNWCSVLYKDLEEGYAMSGTEGCYILDIQENNTKRMAYWGGYVKKDRNELAGIGRLFSKKVLDLMDWQLFNKNADHSIDFTQMKSLLSLSKQWKGKMIKHNESLEIVSMGISTYRWVNKHNFDKETKYPTARVITDPNVILEKYFPEAINLFNE